MSVIYICIYITTCCDADFQFYLRLWSPGMWDHAVW